VIQTCRPIREDKRLRAFGSNFHFAVFIHWGPWCWFGDGLRLNHRADDAAHVIDRNQLGSLRYESVEFARPVCRRHHKMLHAGTLKWPLPDRRRATNAHNKIAKQKLAVPTR
jgi:hypothetical protein